MAKAVPGEIPASCPRWVEETIRDVRRRGTPPGTRCATAAQWELTRGVRSETIDQRSVMKVNCIHRGGAEDRPSVRAVVLARISPDQLAEILDIAEDGIVTVDARQGIVLFNRGAAKIFGYAPEEVVGRRLELLLPARFREPHQGQVEGFARSSAPARLMGERREVYGRRKDGTEFPAEVSISKFGTGAEMLFTAI